VGGRQFEATGRISVNHEAPVRTLPLEQFRRLVKEKKKWQSGSGGNTEILHHEDFPDFTIADGRELVDPFEEDWAKRFPDAHAMISLVEVDIEQPS
jgi:hypothetical protein